MKKRNEKPKNGSHCISGHYVNIDGGNRPFDVELRNARVTYLDRSTRHGQVVDIKVYEGGSTETTTDRIQVHNPDVRMWGGCIHMQGFLLVVQKDGQLLDPEYGNPELPMRLVDLTIRPECGLDDEGKWRED